MLLLATFVTTRFGEWQQRWHNTRPLVARDNVLGADPLHEGVLAILDWESRTIIAQTILDSPAGFCFQNGVLYVGSMFGNRVYVVDRRLEVLSTLSNPRMNDLHSVSPTSRGLLITSSGVDEILEISRDGSLVWRWAATEHGLRRTPTGTIRTLSPREDVRKRMYQTTEQVTHCNSALVVGRHEERVVATLFHQGMVVDIDRRRGGFTILLEGMTCPHSIRPAAGGGWTCCDSFPGSVVLLNAQFGLEGLIEGVFDWTQDAFMLNDLIYVADANHHRIAACTTRGSEVVDEFPYPREWKIFSVDVVPREWLSLG